MLEAAIPPYHIPGLDESLNKNCRGVLSSVSRETTLLFMFEGFFVNGGGVGLEDLRKRINEHLGPDVTIEPSTYNGVSGYILGATNPQIIEHLKDLVRRSGAVSIGQCRDKATVVVTAELMEDDISIDERHESAKIAPISKLPWLASIRNYLSSKLREFNALAIRLPFRKFVGPNRSTLPHNNTVVWNLISLVMFFVSLCLAARYPTQEVRIAFGSFSGLIFVLLLGSTTLDFAKHGDRNYKRNLGNTTLTVLLTIPLMTAMHFSIWYPELNRKVLEVSQDVVPEARFPAVTLFQRLDWSAQAHILPVDYAKCFLGWLEATGMTPMCKNLPQKALVPGQACNCSEDWSSPVVEDFAWQNIAYRYLSFTPSTALISSTPTYIMTLQIFFNYNVTFSLKTSSQEQAPSLYMAVYDPSLSLTDALQRGYSRMVLISANGDSSINLGLQSRQETGYDPAYDYTLGISTVPNLNLVCNTASNVSYPCHITLFLQMPTFHRTMMVENSAMDWLDVAASVGGYFSFVQALSWLMSGQAGAS